MDIQKIETNYEDKSEFVSAIITDSRGRILLLKRVDNLEKDSGKYDMCSGNMRQDEAPMQTLYRKLKEKLDMDQNDIITVEHLGDIPTPYDDLSNTITHMYHVETTLEDVNKINDKLRKIKSEEFASVRFVENFKRVKRIQEELMYMKYTYTKEIEEIYQIIQKKIDDRKELKERECEEK